MNIVVKQAQTGDAEIVAGTLQEAANWLVARNQPLWQLKDLTARIISPQIESGMFWLARADGEAAGCVRFQLEDQEYWGDIPHEDSAFVHRLAVRRKFAGLGVSKTLLDWAKDKARAEGREFLRLDCADRRNLRAVYENYGFKFHSFKEKEPYKVARYEIKL